MSTAVQVSPETRFARVCPTHDNAVLEQLKIPGRVRDAETRANLEDVMVCRAQGGFHRVGEFEWQVVDLLSGEVVEGPTPKLEDPE